jgi:hypothetical protein
MGRQRSAVQVNQFIGGLNTEANPLSFPDNNSIDEVNIELTTRGTRKRRTGFDVEPNYVVVDTGVTYSTTLKLGRSQFRWENPGGTTTKHFVVIQIGNYLAIHDADALPISSGGVFSFTFNVSTYSTDYSYAIVDGNLVIATGLKTPTVLSYDGTTVTKTDPTLLVRDLWGVVATDSSSNVLTTPSLTSYRPGGTATATHVYNLRNQTFALPHVEGDADTQTVIDPIAEFYAASGNTVYPSNADSVLQFLVADANKATNRTVERFNGDSMFKTPPGNTLAPKGYFVIDALNRGASRNANEALLRGRNGALSYAISTLPVDITPGGPTVVASYASRAWYAGFSGVVTGGDALSPHMDSYILFSKQVKNKLDIPYCYQEGDPTSNLDPDVVDTDGGFLKIEGIGPIKAMVPMETSLFVIAENGVWRIVGTDENSFTATQFSISKITTDGCFSPQSVVAISSGIMYWGEDGIYLIAQNDGGLWASQNIIRNSIQTYFNGLSADDKRSVVGYYDINDPSVRWIFGNGLQLRQGIEELIFNIKFQAFTRNTIGVLPSVFGPLTAVGGVNRVTPLFRKITPKKSFYSIIVTPSPTLRYTFGGYRDNTVMDWVTYGGIDTPGYLIAGAVNKGSARLRKDVPYLSTFFENLNPIESSCFIQSQWDWTSSSLSNRWSIPRQAFRAVRSDPGLTMVTTRNKIRGGGKSVAFKFSTETNKPFHLYGWEFNLEATTDE